MIKPGIYSAVLTPLHEDLSINHDLLASHCLDMITRGCQGIALFGTTGEGPSFSLAERLESLEKLIANGFDPKKIILVNGSSGISDTVALGRMVLKKGCAALLVAPPSFYKNISDVGVIAYYRKIIEQIASPDFRMLLYHFPKLTNVPITLPIIDALRKEFPHNVVGLKESEGNIDFTKSILTQYPGFQVFVGKEQHIPEAVRHGGSGSICGIANLYPELIHTLFNRPQESDIEKIDAISQALEGLSYIPAAKAIMESREGASWRTICPPLIPLTKTQSHELMSRLQIVFDEFYNYADCENHEWKAFQEFLTRNNLGADYLAYNSNHEQVAVKVTNSPSLSMTFSTNETSSGQSTEP